MYQQYVIQDKKKLQQIEDGLLATYFKNYDQDFLTTDTGREDIKANVYRRYNSALKHVVPWVAKQIDLAGKTIVEIGSGTGASTAAFAHFVQKIDGYDIDKQALDGAKMRMDVMGFGNVSLHLITPEQLVSTLKKNHSAGVDIILLFAVLEHQTIQERHDTLQLCWDMLKPGGLLVVNDTPNLLYYTDLHTSLLPFLHLLPTELYARYSKLSPREGFNNSFSDRANVPFAELDTSIMRWGRGVSYHDFELALGQDHGKFLVANGFEQEILSWVDVSFEEELLRHYFVTKAIGVPLAFSRVVLNLIYKKDDTVKGDNSNSGKIPENTFIADMEVVRRQHQSIQHLEQQLNDILSSKRWKIGNVLAAPYRKLKRLFS